MKRLNRHAWIGSAGLFVLILLVAGCVAGTSLKNLPAVQPVETLPENIVLEEANTAAFKIRPPTGRVLSMTKDNITVQIVYWRRADLDRKYNRGNAFSPFYETEALHQGDKTDVFYVKVTNNAATPVVYRIKGTRQVPCEMVDQGENRYGSLDYDALKERLTYMSRASGIYVTNGLRKAREILIETQLLDTEKGIPPGESIEGFLPFYQMKHNAETLTVIIPLELKPPEGTATRYKRIVYEFPFAHFKGIRLAQPAPHRY
ncbi:hypothetical protein C6502_13350 [Candidatus Poribacteria bacterium]|nr:MAG: hypothetical protein C6502_13350 [Candidatus Poribacteria bacterium]